MEALKKQHEYYVPDQSCNVGPESNISEISTTLIKQIMDDMVGLAWEIITSPADTLENEYKPI